MPRMKKVEKVNDVKGTLVNLFKNLDKWRYLLIVSILLALVAAILSTVAPNRLAGVTDVITEGIKPRVENIEVISKEIFKHSNIKVNTFGNSMEDTNYLDMYNNLSKDEKLALFNEFEYKGVLISKEDQVKYFDSLSTVNKDSTDEALESFDDMPKSIKSFIEPKMNVSDLKIKSIILGIIYLLNSLFTYIQGIIMAYVGIGYSKKLRQSISRKINKLPLKYFDSHETGDVLSRVTNDVDTIGINMSNTITSLVTNVTLFLGSIVMMFVTNPIMALTAILSSIIGFVFSFFLLKRSQKYFVQRQKELGDLNGHIEEIYSGHNVVKAYNGEKSALEEFDEINERLYDCNRKSQFLSGIMQPIMSFIGNFGYVAVCVVGALLVMNGKTSFGVIVAFMIYVRLFTNPLSRIAQAMTTMQSILAAAERVFEFTNKDKTIIKNFSAKVKAGEKIAIVGPTGAGKTTMVNLLMKFYEINSGDIIIDGVSIKDLKRENIHDLFCMVLQNTWLFDGTIKDNIKYNGKDISDETVWEACRIVGIDHFINTLPGGIDSVVGDNEVISSGQKQLITIARGMIEDAPFLILDEATSNVDTRTEELVQKAMDKLTKGRTSFIIAHRLSTIKNADLILVMNEGNIVEQGKHDELLKKDGFYAKLYNSQFQK